MRVSLTKKIFFNFLILSIVPILIIDTYFYYKSKEALINRTFDQLTTVRIEKQNRLNSFFNQRFDFLKTLSNLHYTDTIFSQLDKNDSAVSGVFSGLKEILMTKDNKNNLCCRIIFVSNRGKKWVWHSQNKKIFQRLNPKDSLETQILKAVIRKSKQSKKAVIYDEKNDFSMKSHSIFMANAITNNEKYLGTIILEISLNAINKIMYENNPHNGLGKTGETYLVGEDYYMRSSSRFKDNSIFKIKVETEGVKKAFQGQTGTAIIRDYRNIPVLSSFNKINIPELNWAVLAEIDEQEAMVPIYLIRNDIIFMSIILSILLLGLVELLSSRITAPLKNLKQATDKLREGKYERLVSINSNDEIGDLGLAFNKMITQLDSQSARLEEERMLRAKSLFDGQEMERQRLSRELHDSLGQSILALKMKFEQLNGVSEEKKQKVLEEIKTLFQKIMTEIRNISNDLMPAVLSEFGLIMALKKMCREVETQTGISIHFYNEIQQEVFEKKMEVYIYRIVQESLSNSIKHADATQIELLLKETDKTITLLVSDNGNGFQMNEAVYLKGNGLSNMKERIKLLNGNIRISTNMGEGTRIYCEIPKTRNI